MISLNLNLTGLIIATLQEEGLRKIEYFDRKNSQQTLQFWKLLVKPTRFHF